MFKVIQGYLSNRGDHLQGYQPKEFVILRLKQQPDNTYKCVVMNRQVYAFLTAWTILVLAVLGSAGFIFGPKEFIIRHLVLGILPPLVVYLRYLTKWRNYPLD